MKITVATANIAGGARQEAADPRKFETLSELLCNGDVDVAGVQEVVKIFDKSGDVIRDDLEALTKSTVCKGFFFCNIDSVIYSHPGKWESPLFKPYFEDGCRILQGAAILLRKDHLFVDFLRNRTPGGRPVITQILPWYFNEDGPVFYQGNRDTEPRSLLLARVEIKGKYALFGATQLSTLSGERSDPPDEPARKRAVRLRKEQLEWICRYMKSYNRAIESFPGVSPDATFLVGDFNGDEKEIDRNLDGCDLKRIPASGDVAMTHRKHEIVIDHICGDVDGKAKIINLADFELNKKMRISDHNPVMAEFTL